MPDAAVIIPARYASTRFPGKPLALLAGRPLILHVLDRARQAKRARHIVVATDDDRIYRTVRENGGDAVLTGSHHPTGTDRIAEAAMSLSCDIIVNVQGDEPFIRGDMIDTVVRLLEEDSSAGMATLASRIRSAEDLNDPNIVKVVWGRSGYALYFSRAPIPYHRDAWAGTGPLGFRGATGSLQCYRHIGIYGYRRESLFRLSRAEPEPVEEIEKLEQLRALALGIRIRVAETAYESIGVDTPEDLEKAETWLNTSS